LRFLLLGSGNLFERGQGVLLLLKGGLRVPDGHLLFLEGFALFLKGPGERSDGRLLALELDLLALELGLLVLELDLLLLKHRPHMLQLGSPRLGIMSFLLRRGPLDITLTGGSRQLFLWRLLTRPQICHLGVGVDVLQHQIGIVLPKPAHLGVQPVQLVALFARDVPQPLQVEERE